MERYIEIIQKSALFDGIKKDEVLNLLKCMQAHTKSYENEEFVILSGNVVNYISVILVGSVEIAKENIAGNRHILAFLGPAQLFGEGIVCSDKRISPVSVRVKEKSMILFVPYERLIRSCSLSCNFHTQIISNMMLILGKKNYALNSKIDILMLKGMREKLSAYLGEEATRQNKRTFQIVPNRNELAEYLNVSRPSMCRELGRMKEEKIIDFQGNVFTVL